MVPVVNMMLAESPVPNNILWWALALGACFGGNFTLVGASANIVSAGVAKQAGVDVSFLEFMKVSVLVAVVTLIIASLYLMLYLRLSL
jgi:Na+/H+ antiporter NhaD/arsenite permease-like protein